MQPVEAAANFLNEAVKPALVGGPNLRLAKAGDAFLELADASGYAVAVMPSAKGMVPENHPHFIDTYWGVIGTAFCNEIVESADAAISSQGLFSTSTAQLRTPSSLRRRTVSSCSPTASSLEMAQPFAV